MALTRVARCQEDTQMADNALLEEFAAAHPGRLQRRLTDAFDRTLSQTDDEAAEVLSVELIAMVEERVHALGQD